jgi:integrase
MPRRRNSRTPKHCRHKRSGHAYVRVGGKQAFLGKYGSDQSLEKYRRLIAELKVADDQSADAGGRNRAGEITIVELISLYYRHAKQYYVRDGQSTGSAKRLRPVLSLLRSHYGRLLSAKIGPLALKALRQSLVDAGHSRTYVNMNVERIKQMFKWAVGEELVPPSVYQALGCVAGLRKGRSAARETPPVEAVSDSDVIATLDYLPQTVADMVGLQRACGCRPGEVRLIRPCDVDRSADPWVYRPICHKTEHHGLDRVIFLGPRAQAILRPYLLRDATAYCFSPGDAEAKRGGRPQCLDTNWG